MKLWHTPSSRSVRARAFTIIEIAICLGIIGFALVAIIAALPRGLDVQKQNREETIIGQDAQVWMNALRSGARGYDDLTNYVLCITNFWTEYDFNYAAGGSGYAVLGSGYDFYTPTNSKVTMPIIIPAVPSTFSLSNGAIIVGLLSMPKTIPEFIPPPTSVFYSNYVVAYVRAFSGPIVDKTPQNNATILADAFTYRMIVENFPYTPIDTNSICMNCPAAANLTTAQLIERTNLLRSQWLLLKNAHDFRLRFRWPVLPNGRIPNNGLATFRSMADGELMVTNQTGQPPLYLVQASTYGTNSPP